MKKKIFWVLLLVSCLLAPAFAQEKANAAEQKPVAKTEEQRAITKTYELKFINPEEAKEILRPYFWQYSLSPSLKLLTVTIPKENIAAFEELLRKIDIEKRNIQFRIFTIIATNKGNEQTIENKDLKMVLDELKKVLSFKNYYLDGTSAINIKDGSRNATLTLSANASQLRMEFFTILVETNARNERMFRFGFEIRELDPVTPWATVQQNGTVTSQQVWRTLIETSSTSIKEKGYLVAGVSKIGKDGDSLVLVINAEIK